MRWFERSAEEQPAERQAMKALAKLPREQREVIVLKIWHGYTFAEIADVACISANTAAGRYRYGLEKIRNLLKRFDYEEYSANGETVAWLGSAPPISPD